MTTDRIKVLFILPLYPMLARTYMSSEVEAMWDDYDIRIIAYGDPELPAKNPRPFVSTSNIEGIQKVIDEFRPQILHAHFLTMAPTLAQLAEKNGIGFTIRSHSTDCSQFIHTFNAPAFLYAFRAITRAVNSDTCLGVLNFPFFRKPLIKRGLKEEKLIDCYPVIDFKRFYDRSPNGEGVLNVGSYFPKKKFEDFVNLGNMVTNQLTLLPMGSGIEKLKKYADDRESNVNIFSYVQPEEMPGVYKNNNWLVYTACPQIKRVGWPMAIAEAQASGLGVCMSNIRPDLKEYLGGAGFLFDSINEVPDIISKPYPDEMREIGFEQARKSDISEHKFLLTDLWNKFAKRPPKVRKFTSFSTYEIFASPLRKICFWV